MRPRLPCQQHPVEHEPHYFRTKVIVGAHEETQTQLQDPLMVLALVLGLIILVVPRLLFLPPPSRLQPMVAEFGQTALRLSTMHEILSSQYAVVTLAQYKQLTPGMHLLTVERIVGIGSEVRMQRLSSGAIAPTDLFTITYEWINPDGSRMVATFRDMKLIGKAQAGLK